MANDGDSWFACFTHPVGDVSVTYSNWHAEDGETVQHQFILVKSVGPNLDVAIDTDSWEGLPAHNQNLTFDLHRGKDGIGIGIPFEKDRKPVLGLRKDLGSIVLYGAFQNGSASIFGATYTDKSRADYDFAISGETTWFRCSKSFGRWTPELRFQWSDNESTAGFGLAYSY